ncbi:glycosyltransferase family 4 protein [Parabacteroides acidifaciens]|uniref:Glycosyltransferase family 1 protein n=1 Tax=Parabacteroides acidifaciens TaxID=2290935 RepID=A0A3D8HG70_9BACT|nr:glycosyltransferase family 1 protein [Parabacteroides acidifaciens]MBC8601298.1 glycosyltransferase family 4 protein [Parabacteroides acidifaciens]RDU49979.1 glycosyltransferase family 1 protein [Parabacteroides acidifaciens]
MNITYFHRNPSSGYSIGKVSQTYIAEIEKKEHIENFYMPCAKADILSILKNIRFAFVHRNRKGINHITGDVYYLAFVLPRKKTVITLHDIGYLEYSKGMKHFLYKIFWFYLPFWRSAKVICISEETKQKVIKYKLCSPHKLTVIPNAIDASFKSVENTFNTICPRILCIGTGENKNLYRTIEALHGIPCHLRIVGIISTALQEHLQFYQINYSNVYHLSDAEIINEYVQSDIVSFVSWYEGFGMPIIEAQAIGRPVLTSNISPMKEIAANGAVLVDPYDVSAIQKGFISIIENGELRDKIVKEGLYNVEKYTPSYVANAYLQIYHTL